MSRAGLRTCTATPGERVVRGVVALVLVGAAVSLQPTTIAGAIAAGVAALLVAIMAGTGYCPASRAAAVPADGGLAEPLRVAGVADARGLVGSAARPNPCSREERSRQR